AGTYTNRVLAVELGGTAPGTGHDRLVVTGAATLADTLRLSLVGPYVPAVGDTYTILTAGDLSGTFATVLPPPGVAVDVSYDEDAHAVVVTVTDGALLTVVRTEPVHAPSVPSSGGLIRVAHEFDSRSASPLSA